MGSRALALTTPGPLCGHALCREGVLAHKAVYDGRRSLKLRQHPPSHLRQSRFSVSCGSSSFSADAKDFVEKAVSELSPETEGSSRLANNRWDFRSRLHNTWCFVRKKLWVAALAMFYLYNEAAAKVPWLKAKQFEAWFWKQVRGTWLPAASAATVLARQYFKGASKDMWFTPGGLLQRKDVVEAEVKEDVEQVTQGLEENLEQQSASVGQRLPDAVNPLLLGQNLRERLDAGALDLPAFEAAMAEVKQMVPFLDAGEGGEAVQAELEAQTRDGERREAEALSSGHVAGFLNLPLPSSLGGPPQPPPHADATAQGKAAVADAKQDVGHRKGPAWPVLGFLGGIGGGRGGASEEKAAAAAAKKAVEEQKQGGFSFRGLFGSKARNAEKAKAAAAEAKAAEERDSRGFSWEALKSAFSSEEKAAAEEVKGSAAPRGGSKGWRGLNLPFLGRSAEEAQTKAAEDDAEEDRGLVLGFLKQNLLGQSGEGAEQEAAAAAQGEEKPEGGLLGLFQKVKRTPDSTQSAAEAAEEEEEEEEAKGLLSKVLNLGQ